MKSTRAFSFLLLAMLGAVPVLAQKDLAGAAAIKQSMERLKVAGSVLMIAAHPDDENTAVLAYFARGRHLETGYLSLTRGEGGQNFIGPEQGARLGIIRTEELLDARHIDGAQQFFTRAIDFGFTKTAEETFAKWGREQILGDVVWTIRRFRPDVILLRFTGTPRDGHGQHQASAILGREAFSAAADPSRFPEQLAFVKPWQAKRLMWNAFAFNREQEEQLKASGGAKVQVDVGAYNPVLGYSYGEIAGMSRSMHRSQAMGAPERHGSMDQFFITIAGDVAKTDVFENIDTTWNRVKGGSEVAALIDQADAALTFEHPEKAIPALTKARAIAANLHDPWAERKLPEIDQTIALCAGLLAEATADQAVLTPGSNATINLTVISRGPVAVHLDRVGWEGTATGRPQPVAAPADLKFNEPLTKKAEWTIGSNQPYTQPYWLVRPPVGEAYSVPSQALVGRPENPPVLEAVFEMTVDGSPIVLRRPVINRYIDRARGELVQPISIIPALIISMPENAVVLVNGEPRRVDVPVKSEAGALKGSLRLTAPKGWSVKPVEAPFDLAPGQQAVLSFTVQPPRSGQGRAEITADAKVDGHDYLYGLDVIDHEHIEPQRLLPRASSTVVAVDVHNGAKRIGYVMGAGDEVPRSLEQIGCEVTMLSADDLAKSDLSRFDAIVTGVRAWNVRSDLQANRQRLLDYMQNGGTLVVQYNVLEGGFGRGNPKSLEDIGPYPIKISRDRVTVEEAPVEYPNPQNPLLHKPNEFTAADWQGWVQERGLYFASEWDPHYTPLFTMHDPGEKPMSGSTLVTPYGKGAYVFSSLSWFRELPAGVPGAFRIFANFLNAGKVLADAR